MWAKFKLPTYRELWEAGKIPTYRELREAGKIPTYQQACTTLHRLESDILRRFEDRIRCPKVDNRLQAILPSPQPRIEIVTAGDHGL